MRHGGREVGSINALSSCFIFRIQPRLPFPRNKTYPKNDLTNQVDDRTKNGERQRSWFVKQKQNWTTIQIMERDDTGVVGCHEGEKSKIPK